MGHPFVRSVACAAVGLISAAALPACTHSSSAASQSCTAEFWGNVADSSTLPAGCGVLSFSPHEGPSGGYVLSLEASSAQIAGLTVAVDLGASPTPGSLSSETVTDWNVVGLSNARAGASPNCVLGAGSSTVPTGSFTLVLSSVDGADPSSSGTAHGTLDVTMYVHAPPKTDCGIGDVEDVHFVF